MADAADLRAYAETVLRHGSGRQDGLWLRAAYEASSRGGFEGWSLLEIVTTATALRGSRELALESTA